MADRRPSSRASTGRGPGGIAWDDIAEIPEPQRSVVEADLPRVERWLREHPEIHVSVALDRARFDAGQGHVLLVVTVQGDAATVRRELESVMANPDRLRVRVYRPSPEELQRVLRWVIDTRMTSEGGSRTFVTVAGVDERAGVVVVALNRRDPQYADELVALTEGLVRVEPEPTNMVPLGPTPIGDQP